MTTDFVKVMNAVRGRTGVAKFAHGLWSDARRKREAQERYPEFRTLLEAREALDYLEEGCQCSVCIIYGGDCPRHEAMLQRATVVRRWVRRIERHLAPIVFMDANGQERARV